MKLVLRSLAALSLSLVLAATALSAQAQAPAPGQAPAPAPAPAASAPTPAASGQVLPPASAAEWAAQAAADRAAAKARLAEYAQVDPAAGLYQVPIARAIELMVASPDLLAPIPMVQVNVSTLTPVQRGELIFNKLQPCSTCHSIDGSPKLGPSMKGAWGRTEKLVGGGTVTVDEAYIRESIATPMAKVVEGFAPIMPPVVLTDEELIAVVAYIQSLK